MRPKKRLKKDNNRGQSLNKQTALFNAQLIKQAESKSSVTEGEVPIYGFMRNKSCPRYGFFIPVNKTGDIKAYNLTASGSAA